eukprot:INCI13457.10.p1 GENE.INCI13457.10~~INCI13457.10.p1  ORF type:complete len:1429 (+),score=207.09 INCI13457.10:148-4434(+)
MSDSESHHHTPSSSGSGRGRRGDLRGLLFDRPRSSEDESGLDDSDDEASSFSVPVRRGSWGAVPESNRAALIADALLAANVDDADADFHMMPATLEMEMEALSGTPSGSHSRQHSASHSRSPSHSQAGVSPGSPMLSPGSHSGGGAHTVFETPSFADRSVGSRPHQLLEEEAEAEQQRQHQRGQPREYRRQSTDEDSRMIAEVAAENDSNTSSSRAGGPGGPSHQSPPRSGGVGMSSSVLSVGTAGSPSVQHYNSQVDGDLPEMVALEMTPPEPGSARAVAVPRTASPVANSPPTDAADVGRGASGDARTTGADHPSRAGNDSLPPNVDSHDNRGDILRESPTNKGRRAKTKSKRREHSQGTDGDQYGASSETSGEASGGLSIVSELDFDALLSSTVQEVLQDQRAAEAAASAAARAAASRSLDGERIEHAALSRGVSSSSVDIVAAQSPEFESLSDYSPIDDISASSDDDQPMRTPRQSLLLLQEYLRVPLDDSIQHAGSGIGDSSEGVMSRSRGSSLSAADCRSPNSLHPYAHFKHRPVSDRLPPAAEEPNICKTRGCIIACIAVIVLVCLGCLGIFVAFSYCLHQYIGQNEWAWDPAQVGSYCPWLGTQSDLFYRLLPAALSGICLLIVYALASQLWWSVYALRSLAHSNQVTPNFDQALGAWDEALQAMGGVHNQPSSAEASESTPNRAGRGSSSRSAVVEMVAVGGVAASEARAALPRSPANSARRHLKCRMQRVSLFFEGMRYRINDTRILDNACGEIKSGELTAILGPSGCGKTTLMHILLGMLQPEAGTVTINGRPGLTIRDLRKITAFVPQDDIMLPEMTVGEVVSLAARMRLPRTVCNAEVAQFADKVLDVLELSSLRHARIGDEHSRGLSGGQKKRVNVAMELAMNPSLVFLDEPTSGLDASMALRLMRCLRRAADAGWAVCLVIHQPSSAIYKALDSVIVMGQGGRTLFSGPTEAADIYFRSVKPDYFPDADDDQMLALGRLGPAESKRGPAPRTQTTGVNMAETILDIASSHPYEGDLARLWDQFLAGMSQELRDKRRWSREASAGVSVVVDVPVPGADDVHGSHGSQPVESDIEDGGGRHCHAVPEAGEVWGGVKDCCRQYHPRVRVNCMTQYLLLLQRSLTQKLRAWASVVRNGVLVMLLGGGVGFLFQDIGEACVSVDDCDNLPGLISSMVQAFVISILCITIVAMQAGLDDFGAERLVYFREQRADYAVIAYAFAKFTAALPLTFIYSYIFSVVTLPLFKMSSAPFGTCADALRLLLWMRGVAPNARSCRVQFLHCQSRRRACLILVQCLSYRELLPDLLPNAVDCGRVVLLDFATVYQQPSSRCWCHCIALHHIHWGVPTAFRRRDEVRRCMLSVQVAAFFSVDLGFAPFFYCRVNSVSTFSVAQLFVPQVCVVRVDGPVGDAGCFHSDF